MAPPKGSTIYVSHDHAGVALKRRILQRLAGYTVVDLGPQSAEPVDYPDVAFVLAKRVASEKARGILICRSGIGMSIAANRIKGVRAALCVNEKMAELSRRHNDANVLVLAADHTDASTIDTIIDIWLTTPFDGDAKGGERHKRRVEQLDRC